ncbi:MAG: D-alanine--D-alanine ligase [Bacteroidetes bacterium]|nr:D-alanine--D-alanine ligase [Bacteroidota bacterium]
MDSRKKVAVVCGGYSGEFEVSAGSGQVVFDALDRKVFEPYLVFIFQDKWICRDHSGAQHPIDRNDFSVQLVHGKLFFDAVFIAVHGVPGEDGKLQGYFDMLGLPYTSCNAVVSALTFNKHFCKQVVAHTGIRLSRSILLRKGEAIDSEEMIRLLGFPMFVKPNSNGSSVGVSKVKTAEQLLPAIEHAFSYDQEVLVEEAIHGREIACGIFEFKGRMMVFPLTEIISHNEFFDYEAKYTAGKSEEITPARLDEETVFEIQATTVNLYKWLGCRGIVRFDYILSDKGLYFLEVNTVPGFSRASIIPQQAQAMGLSLEQLFGMAVQNVLP